MGGEGRGVQQNTLSVKVLSEESSQESQKTRQTVARISGNKALPLSLLAWTYTEYKLIMSHLNTLIDHFYFHRMHASLITTNHMGTVVFLTNATAVNNYLWIVFLDFLDQAHFPRVCQIVS